MGHPKATRAAFITAWRESGGEAKRVAEIFDMTIPRVYDRRKRIEASMGIDLPSAGIDGRPGRGDAGLPHYNYNPRLAIDGFVGRVVVFNDCHWWPGISKTVAYKALIEVIKEDKPKLVIGNGDLLDGARISRFGRSDWGQTPTMLAELEEVKERCAEIRHAYRNARHVRTVGNHDQRFDKYLAQRANEFEGIEGFRLSDHLKEWEETVAVWVNGHAVIKHRWHGGIHGAWQNVLKSGMTMVTGHTHTLLCRPFVDYRGRRYGIEGGTLAEPASVPFAYGEDNPSQACSGFLVLTFDSSGRVLYPEICEVIDGRAYFRSKVIVDCGKKARKNGLISA